MRNPPWTSIKPGDIGFDGGVGISGWLIRRSTGAHGHCFVYHELLGYDGDDELWRTVEAGPREGVIYRTRTRRPNKVVRLWRNPIEQHRILAASASCIGSKYGWGEIARIVLHLVGIKVEGWKDNPDRMICSNHVAFALSKARSGLAITMPYKPPHIWPQKLAEWCDWVFWMQSRAEERKR